MSYTDYIKRRLAESVSYPEVLPNGDAIADYIETVASEYVDVEMMREFFRGSKAILKMVPTDSIKEGPRDNNIRNKRKQSKYDRMDPNTMPPIVVENGVVVDGNHRLRSAIANKMAMVPIYDVVEIERVSEMIAPQVVPIRTPPGSLYHGTGLDTLYQIMTTNTLKEGKHYGWKNEPHGPRMSLSRDNSRRFAMDTSTLGRDYDTGAVLELSGPKLFQSYQLVRYRDVDRRGDLQRNEREVVALTPAITPLSDYLVAIHVPKTVQGDWDGPDADHYASTIGLDEQTYLRWVINDLFGSGLVRMTL